MVRAKDARSILKIIWRGKHRWLGHILNFLRKIIEAKMMGKATRDVGVGKMELLHDIMENVVNSDLTWTSEDSKTFNISAA